MVTNWPQRCSEEKSGLVLLSSSLRPRKNERKAEMGVKDGWEELVSPKIFADPYLKVMPFRYET